MTILKIAAAAVALLAGIAASSGAVAECWWTGYGYSCNQPPPEYGYGYGPISQFDNPATYGYVPRGLPHPNGPQPGGGGCFMGQAKDGCGDE